MKEKLRNRCPLGVFSDMYYFKVSFGNPLLFVLLFIVIDSYHHALIYIFIPCCYSVMAAPHCFSHNCSFMNSYYMLYFNVLAILFVVSTIYGCITVNLCVYLIWCYYCVWQWLWLLRTSLILIPVILCNTCPSLFIVWILVPPGSNWISCLRPRIDHFSKDL